MAEANVKVCLVTGAAGGLGQKVLARLVEGGRKVLALGEVSDGFFPDELTARRIKVTTALPANAAALRKNDVQFLFGDVSDISFLATVFSLADKNGLEIEFVIHLSGNEIIQKNSMAAYHPAYGDTVNLLEVTRAYWQGHQDIFKGFFYAADTGKKAAAQIEKLIDKVQLKDGFPAMSYRSAMIGAGYRGKTKLSSLYRFISPVAVKMPVLDEEKGGEDYVLELNNAIESFIGKKDAGAV